MNQKISRRMFASLAGGAGAALAFSGGPALAAAGAAEPHTYLLVFSDPVAGGQDGYDAWFKGDHVRQMQAIDGVLAARRLVPVTVELRHSPIKPPHDLVFYTIANDRFDAARDAIGKQAEAGGAWPPAAVATVRTYTYRAYRPPMKGVGGEPAGAKPGAAAEYETLAFGDAVAGREHEYDDWYDTVHEPELMSRPGVVGGRRAVLNDVQIGPPIDRRHYLFVLDMVTTDLPAVFHEIVAGGPPSPTMDRTHSFGFTYQAVGP